MYFYNYYRSSEIVGAQLWIVTSDNCKLLLQWRQHIAFFQEVLTIMYPIVTVNTIIYLLKSLQRKWTVKILNTSSFAVLPDLQCVAQCPLSEVCIWPFWTGERLISIVPNQNHGAKTACFTVKHQHQQSPTAALRSPNILPNNTSYPIHVHRERQRGRRARLNMKN